MKTLWLIKKTDIPRSYIDEDDTVILIEDAVLKVPSKPNWFVCSEDAAARRIEVPPGKGLSYPEIAKMILKAKKVVVW